MKIALRRISLGMSTVIAAASMAVVLAPAPASAASVVKFYPYTTTGAKRCNADAKLGGAEYFCSSGELGGVRHYILMRY